MIRTDGLLHGQHYSDLTLNTWLRNLQDIGIADPARAYDPAKFTVVISTKSRCGGTSPAVTTVYQSATEPEARKITMREKGRDDVNVVAICMMPPVSDLAANRDLVTLGYKQELPRRLYTVLTEAAVNRADNDVRSSSGHINQFRFDAHEVDRLIKRLRMNPLEMQISDLGYLKGITVPAEIHGHATFAPLSLTVGGATLLNAYASQLRANVKFEASAPLKLRPIG
jgi:hypothetical protein